MPPGQDIRLALLLILNAIVVSAAFYAARRWTRDPLQRLLDVALLWYLVQYLAVCIPGVLHCLTAISMSITAILISAALVMLVHGSEPLAVDAEESTRFLPAVLGLLFLLAFLIQLLIPQRWLPVTDSDGLTYHAPAAIHWMQTRRLSLLPLWFFNPANTYSPLAGSTFVFWLMAPLRSDVLFRFVQAPAILLLFASMVQLGRLLGVKPWPAVFCALVAGSRMACSEINAVRDDLLLSAFVALALTSFGRSALQDRMGPWRVGIALALMLATKYTALISLPPVLLLWGAPKRAGWTTRQRLITTATILVLAEPWYFRNFLLTGNPVFPMRVTLFGHTIFPGLFTALTSQRVRSWHEIRRIFVGGYHGMPILLLIVLAIGYLAALIMGARRWRDPMVRACLFGPLLCVALFLARAPFGEVRFLYPAFFVMCVAVGSIALGWNFPAWVQLVISFPFCVALGLAALCTSYDFADKVESAFLAGSLAAVIGFALAWLKRTFPACRHRLIPGLAVVLSLVFSFWIYVKWNAYVDVCHLDEIPVWHNLNVWPDDGPAWRYFKENISPTATIAYTQTFLIYPLIGDDLTRQVVYIPVRADTPDFLHHPVYPRPLHGEEIGDLTVALLNAPADQTIWRKRLTESKAQYLYIKLNGPDEQPPELLWALADPQHFMQVFRDKNNVIYQIQS